MNTERFYLQKAEVVRNLSIGNTYIKAEYYNGTYSIEAVFEHGEEIPTIVNRDGEEIC